MKIALIDNGSLEAAAHEGLRAAALAIGRMLEADGMDWHDLARAASENVTKAPSPKPQAPPPPRPKPKPQPPIDDYEPPPSRAERHDIPRWRFTSTGGSMIDHGFLKYIIFRDNYGTWSIRVNEAGRGHRFINKFDTIEDAQEFCDNEMPRV